MARTRSKPAKASPKESTPEPAASAAKSLPTSVSNPPKLFVLPKDTSKDARIVTLDNPANGSLSKYFFCPTKGFYEFTRIAAPKKDCKSWLITSDSPKETTGATQTEAQIGSGYITKSADIFLATPIDLLFLILPALAPKSTKDTKQHFLALDDYLDKLSSTSHHWRALIAQYSCLRDMLEKRMRATCDSVEAGDETMYRLSDAKLLDILKKKAERMVSRGLPPSLEDKFVKTPLDVPVMNIKREDSSLSSTEPPSQDPSKSQPARSDADTSNETEAPIPTLATPPEVPHLLRLRTSLTYLSHAYLPPTLQPLITTHLSSPFFLPLTAHLSAISALKTEALALRSISDNISRKRAVQEDDERVAEREEKKRKKDEEEKKKKSEGRGVRALKKVNTSGMRKMSAFFTAVGKKT